MFENRSDAGQKLGAKLQHEPILRYIDRHNLLVLSIPRGGVVVGAEVAQRLGCPHEIVAVKKIGFPGREELALGAVAEDGVEVIDQNAPLTWPPQATAYSGCVFVIGCNYSTGLQN